MRWTGQGGWKARAAFGAALGALAAAGLLLACTRVEVEGRWRGLFLLRSPDGHRLELHDDLYLGDGPREVVGLSFTRVRRWLGLAPPPPVEGRPHLHLEWDERAGRGMVLNDLGDGRELVTYFGRYVDDAGGHPQGLFVGGAVPDVALDMHGQNESGMALHSGGAWEHVWCNVNESLVDEGQHYVPISPGAFRFLGSRVLVQDGTRVVLESNHEVATRRGRLRMDRFAYFEAGAPFFELAILLTSLGPAPVDYTYLYGDEPWVGTFGDATGNLGWVEGAIVPFEGRLDPNGVRWAGIVDQKSGVANFIEWLGEDQPDEVYFSNHGGRHADAAQAVPLGSNEIFIGLQWNHRRLAPGEVAAMRLVVGLADRDPATGRPRRPAAAGRQASR
jgi:hypothetical protein